MPDNYTDLDHLPEPDEQKLEAALKEKDDIPVLMDVFVDERKQKASQEAYLFQSLTDPIPILSEVSDEDVAHAFAEGTFANQANSDSKNEEKEIVEEQGLPTVEEQEVGLDGSMPEAPEVIILPCDSSEKTEEIDFSEAAEVSDAPVIETENTENLLPEEGVVNQAHHSKEEASEDVKAQEEAAAEADSTITMVKTTTFDQDDLQNAIEKAFTKLLPKLMEEVLQELSSDKKE